MGVSSNEAMNSNQNLTYNRQSAHLLPTCYHDQTSSSTSKPSSLSQPLGDPDLFATLLFDRQRAYQRPSSTLLAPYSSSQSKVRDVTPAMERPALKHGSKATVMPPGTKFMSEKQKRQVKGMRIIKTLSAKPDTKPTESRVGMGSEVVGETASRKDSDIVMISSDEEEVQEIQQLRSELKAANARSKQLEDLLETKETTSRNPNIGQDSLGKIKAAYGARESKMQDPTRNKGDMASKESAPLAFTNSQAMDCTVEVPLPLTLQSPLSSMLPISPYPSSNIIEGDLKLENVRATYTKVKRKLDTLNVIVRKLDWCTKSMDFSSFGEFGVHMKQLREWLEEDEQQLQRQQQKKS